MSRKGKLPIAIPNGVKVEVKDNQVQVTGPKGTLTEAMRKDVTVSVEGDQVLVALADGFESSGKFQGLYRSLIDNLVIGVTKGFTKNLDMIGVGFRAAVQGQVLDLQIGVSHPVKVDIPQGINVKVEKNTAITIEGASKQQVGQFAADVRSLRPPEPYKGKGIRYRDEVVRRKAGKAGKGK